jgi:predicted enzyme related to lactoylglutathione lyase
MSRVIHFEISVDNPERALKFYRTVFGWKTQKWKGPEDYWLITTGDPKDPGIDGAFQRRTQGVPPTVNVIATRQIDRTLDIVVKAGGKVVHPKGAVPGVGWAAYCTDSEGNLFGLMQGDPSAK